jgi:hypothetical protein
VPVLKSVVCRHPPEFLKDGQFGNVYKTRYTMRFDSTALAYKEYKAIPPGQGRPGLTAKNAVVLRDSLPRNGLDILDRYFAWPREVVMDDATSEICGFLMPLADKDFYWKKGRVKGQLRTLDWLAAPEPFWQVNGVAEEMATMTATDRLFLMTQLTGAVSWLHRRRWVFGDLSFTNVAFDLPSGLRPPRLMIFDCDDAAALVDQQRASQPHSPYWAPPECESGQQQQQDHETDVYKLGLAIVRCLKPESGAIYTKDVGRLTGILDTDGIALLTRALSLNRSERPSAEELSRYLDGVTRRLMVPPSISNAELVTPLVMRGGDAQIIWRIEGAQEIRVFVGDNRANLVRRGKPTDYPDGCAFPVTLPGQVTVVADNRYGPTVRIIGSVAPFEIPPLSLELDKLPRPDIPRFPGYTEKPFPPRPAGPPAAPEIPALRRLEFAELLRELAPGGTIGSPGAHINTVLDGSRSLMDLIHADTERFIAVLRRKNLGNGHG